MNTDPAYLDPQAQRMITLGLMAGALAHDMNNLLTVIMSSTSCASIILAEDHPAQSELATIQQIAEHMGGLTHQLLGYINKPVTEQRLLFIDSVLAERASLFNRVVGSKIKLTLATAPDLSPIYAQETQIEQLLLNLLINARDAMPHGGQVTITVAAETITTQSGLLNGEYIRLSITDTGTGIEPDLLERIFDPFYSTKSNGKGTGLGLAICRQVVTQLGGEIRVASVVGQGSEFRMLLPCAAL